MAKDTAGKSIDALKQHLTNLTSPSTPFFFNTLYDPYREGTDFVRGYPFSLREGRPTAVSHGLWLNRPGKCRCHAGAHARLLYTLALELCTLHNAADYDTATSLVKPLERNTRYVDAVLTVSRLQAVQRRFGQLAYCCMSSLLLHLFCSLESHFMLLTQQVPIGALYPMSNINLAFNREIIGPAMYTGLR